MKDVIYSGPDVAGALEAAARALGTPAAQLRFVVLDEGTPGRLGLQAKPARIAVLMGATTASAALATDHPSTDDEELDDDDLPDRIRELGHRLAEASGLDLSLSVDDVDGVLLVKTEGPGAADFFTGEDVLPALEHVLRRWADRSGYDLRMPGASPAGQGQRARRDEALRQRALELADAVRSDGQPRRLEGLNSYERRIVHMALAEAPGIETYSVGEGVDRRVVIAPRVKTLEED